MRKFFYTFAFILCALMTLQAETMVVATYNLRNANGSDSTNGNGWDRRRENHFRGAERAARRTPIILTGL